MNASRVTTAYFYNMIESFTCCKNVFVFKHKYPIKRSAFTFWENDIPSRIDLGKEKYGGPFTYEEVEDVKTMFRLLLLMFSLFGFHLSGDVTSAYFYNMRVSHVPKC